MTRVTTQRKPVIAPDAPPTLTPGRQFPQPAPVADATALTSPETSAFSGDMGLGDTRSYAGGIPSLAPAPPPPPDAGATGHSLSRMRIFAPDEAATDGTHPFSPAAASGNGLPIQRKAAPGSAAPRPPVGGTVQKPQAGETRIGFIDSTEGSNVHSSPIGQAGSRVLGMLPPAAQVVVTGHDAQQPDWAYITATAGGQMMRGYVQAFRVNTRPPEPTARLHFVKPGETLEPIANSVYHSEIKPGRDLRFYENALLYANEQAGRRGIHRTGGDIQADAGSLIWLISASFANSLQGVVSSGSLTGGAWAEATAKVKQAGRHLKDIMASVEESPHHFKKVAGEYAAAIEEHLPEIIGVVIAFVVAEEASAFLAATPTGVGQIAALLIQLVLASLGVQAALTTGAQALQFGEQWLTTAWKANGDPEQIGVASECFIHMLVQIAMAALAVMGAKGNMGKSLKLVDSIHITRTPAFAVVGGGHMGGGTMAVSGDAVALGGPSYMGSVGTAGARVRPEPGRSTDGTSAPEAAEEALERKLANKDLSAEQIEALLQKTPNWAKIKNLIGRRIPPPGTPEYAQFVKDFQEAGYRLDAPNGGLKNFRLVRAAGDVKSDYAPLTVTEDGVVVLKTGGSNRISVASRYRANYLQHVRQTEGTAGLQAAEARLAGGSQLHHLIPDAVAQKSPLVREALERVPGYTIDRGTNILDMPSVHTPPGDVVHLGSHPEFDLYVTRLLDRAQGQLTRRVPLNKVPPQKIDEILKSIEDRVRSDIQNKTLPPEILKDLRDGGVKLSMNESGPSVAREYA